MSLLLCLPYSLRRTTSRSAHVAANDTSFFAARVDYSSFVISFEIGKFESSNSFSKILLAVLGLLHFHMNFRINNNFCKKEIGILKI